MMGPQEAASLLLGARQHRSRRLSALPDSAKPRSAAEAYAVQRAIMAELGAIGGWKVGSPNPTSDVFTCAPLPVAGIADSPAEIGGSDCEFEAEIAVRLGADLPARDTAYGEAEVRAAIASAHPAIEVLANRYAAGAPDPLSALADSLSHHSLVVGPAIEDWQRVDLGGETVRVLVAGQEVKRGTGNPGGDMIRLLLWLANTGARWAGGLRAGQVVTTGSWTGKDAAAAGQTAVIRFEHCGEAAVRFAG